jgi:hypothetical protein
MPLVKRPVSRFVALEENTTYRPFADRTPDDADMSAVTPAELTDTRVVCPANASAIAALVTSEKIEKMSATLSLKTLVVLDILIPPHHTEHRAVDDL